MTVKYLTDIKEFLEQNVAPKISLRGIADKDDTTCLMVSPHVTVGLPITFDTPACVRDKIPGIVVGLAAPIEYSQEIAQIPVELAVVAYCPGTQDDFGLTYDNTGFWDVCNLSDLIVRELFAADTIGGLYLSDRLVQCRPDNEQCGDYWMGSVTFILNEEQMRLDNLVSRGALLGGKIRFDAAATPTNDIVSGDFALDVDYTTTPAARAIVCRYRYSSSGLSKLTGGEE